MKTTLLKIVTKNTAGIFLAASLPCLAADGAKEPGNRPANADPEARLAQMKSRLNLTDEQVAKLKELGPEKCPKNGETHGDFDSRAAGENESRP